MQNFSIDEKLKYLYWNALFIDLELIFKNFPKFNDEHPLFSPSSILKKMIQMYG